MKKLLLLLSLIILGSMAYAQEIAVVDMSVIYKSEYVTNAFNSLQEIQTAGEKEMQIRSENLFLGENELNELLNLVKTNGSQAQIKEYQDNNTKRYEELQVLNQTKTLSDEQKARLTELNNINKKAKENAENRYKKLSEEIQTLAEEKEKEVQKTILDVCEKIAKEKKYSLVIEKSAVFYGGNDITKDIISQLPKVEKK